MSRRVLSSRFDFMAFWRLRNLTFWGPARSRSSTRHADFLLSPFFSNSFIGLTYMPLSRGWVADGTHRRYYSSSSRGRLSGGKPIPEQGSYLPSLVDPDHGSDGHRFTIRSVIDIYGTSSPASYDLRWDDSAMITSYIVHISHCFV
jgi:hypothetical protein